MHNLQWKLFPVLLLCSFKLFSQQSIEIDRYGKRIQIDGFLVEWSEKYCKKWDSSGKWLWDVVNTPEGISGYIRSKTAVPCSSWNITLESPGSRKPFTIDANPGSTAQNSFFRIDQELYKETQKLVIEWVIPWDEADVDTLGRYALDIRLNNRCRDTAISSIMITGNKKPPEKIITNKVIVQGSIIAILLSVYIYIRTKFIRKKHQKRSLHQ
jgi:hypothetical protein